MRLEGYEYTHTHTGTCAGTATDIHAGAWTSCRLCVFVPFLVPLCRDKMPKRWSN
jgi:hypothetical protein